MRVEERKKKKKKKKTEKNTLSVYLTFTVKVEKL